MRTPLTYQQRAAVTRSLCQSVGGVGGANICTAEGPGRSVDNGAFAQHPAGGGRSEGRSGFLPRRCGNRARSHRQLTRLPGTRLASPRGRRDTRARARPEVGPGSRQAALKSEVTAPPVAWALPSRAGDPRPAPRAPHGRFLINSRDSPELRTARTDLDPPPPGSDRRGRHTGRPPRLSPVQTAGPVAARRWGNDRRAGGRASASPGPPSAAS